MIRTLYNIVVVPVAVIGAQIASWFIPKVRESIAGQRGFASRWAQASNTWQESRVWVHVSSVGEYEQAKPIIDRLSQERPDLDIVLTFSSPSGFNFARKREGGEGSNVKLIDYLPLDTRRNMQKCLEIVNPRMLLLVKFDLWPNLLWECERRGVPRVLVDATLSPSSRRHSFWGRAVYRNVYGALNRIVAISDADAARFREAIPAHDSIAVAGDTRFDRVAERMTNATRVTLPLADKANAVTIVAGSTWPPDEAHLLPALCRVLGEHPQARLLIAPHEPTSEHVDPLLEWAQRSELSVARYTELPSDSATEARVLVLDTVGILAEAYRYGDLAYIGGAFTTGVHSVIEPAVASLPVVFGPKHLNSFEAVQLLDRHAGWTGSSENEFYNLIGGLVEDKPKRDQAGKAAREYVESQLGATEKCLAIIGEYL